MCTVGDYRLERNFKERPTPLGWNCEHSCLSFFGQTQIIGWISSVTIYLFCIILANNYFLYLMFPLIFITRNLFFFSLFNFWYTSIYRIAWWLKIQIDVIRIYIYSTQNSTLYGFSLYCLVGIWMQSRGHVCSIYIFTFSGEDILLYLLVHTWLGLGYFLVGESLRNFPYCFFYWRIIYIYS